MKIRALLSYINEVKPNPFPDSVLLLWLNELEGRIQLDILLRGRDETVSYVLPEDSATELLVKAPHSAIYRLWLQAMIDRGNGEAETYQNSMAAFNKAWNAYACWHAETQGGNS